VEVLTWHCSSMRQGSNASSKSGASPLPPQGCDHIGRRIVCGLTLGYNTSAPFRAHNGPGSTFDNGNHVSTHTALEGVRRGSSHSDSALKVALSDVHATEAVR